MAVQTSKQELQCLLVEMQWGHTPFAMFCFCAGSQDRVVALQYPHPHPQAQLHVPDPPHLLHPPIVGGKGGSGDTLTSSVGLLGGNGGGAFPSPVKSAEAKSYCGSRARRASRQEQSMKGKPAEASQVS
eukprot:1157750-Pelagomonas_calceolata.AAC.15